MGDYIREIAGYPHGYNPDAPGDGEILAEMRDGLEAVKAGTYLFAPWQTREENIAWGEEQIRLLEAKIAMKKKG